MGIYAIVTLYDIFGATIKAKLQLQPEMHNETNPYLELGDIELKKAEVRILRSGLRIGSILALAVLIGYQFTIFPAQTVFTMSILTAALGGMMLSIYWWLEEFRNHTNM